MSKGRILIIDDEIGVRQSLKMIFKDDYEVLEAASADEALGKLKERMPDLVILDIVMPNRSGVEILKEIRSIDSGLRVIVISAIRDTAMGKEAAEAGVFAYFTKPFNVVELQRLAREAIKGGGQKEGSDGGGA